MPESDQLSEWLEGAVAPCPEAFNAARYCVGSGGPRVADKEALLAVDVANDAVSVWSFEDVQQTVRRAAGALRSVGVGRGDRVVILLGDVPEFPFAYFGAMAAGAIAAPLSSQLSSAEIESIIRQAQPKVILAARPLDCETADAVPMDVDTLLAGPEVDFADTVAEDPALLVHTSGSSGRPKGVLHAQRSFWVRKSMHAGWHGIGGDDRVMHAGAFNWTFTLGVGLADTWSVGATAILNAGSREPDVWPRLSAQHQPTVFAGAPAVFRRILRYGEGLSAAFAPLNHAVTAGEKLAPAIADAWKAETGKPLLEALGMSEVSTYISTPPDRAPIPGHAGLPQPGRHVAVLGDDGEPVARGRPGLLAVHASDPGLMLGYWQRPDLTRAAYLGDWFVTGDLATMRDDGAIAYAGRNDDQINAQGFRVEPQEVEAAFLRHQDVDDCAVTALKIEEGLSVIAAWIVPVKGAKPLRSELLAEIRHSLAAYKMPREVFLAENLPRTPNGKLMRRDLPNLEAQKLP